VSETWVSPEQVARLLGVSRRSIFERLRAGEFETRAAATSRNGRPRREILLSSLPASAQFEYAAQWMGSAATAETPRPDRERGIVPEHLKAKVEERLRAIEEGPVKSGVPDRTLREWKRRSARGEAALAPKLREDEGVSRRFRDNPRAAAFIQAKYLGEKLSAQLAHDALSREWKTVGDRGGVPSYDAVRKFLRRIPKVTETLARVGKRAAIAQCGPYVIRGRCAAMDCWVADHRVHDVFVYNTLFPEVPPGKAYRMWMTAIVDMGTQKMVGCVWAPTPSSRTICSAIRMGVAQFGFPKSFYCDNGKDFQSVARFLEANSIAVTSALPFNPRSKPIEAFFTRFSKRFDRMWGAGYCGGQPALRSEACGEAQKQHERYCAGKEEKTLFYPDVLFIDGALQFIEEYNAAPQERLDRKSPNQIFDQQWPPTNRHAVDRRQLDQLFWQRDERTILQGGCVELNKVRYEPTDEGFMRLSLIQGKHAMIARDPYNLAAAVAFDLETGEFLGELQVQELVAQTPHGRFSVDGIRAQARRKSKIIKHSRDYLAAVQAIAVANGWKSEPERLLDRALAARTGTDNRLLAAVPGAGAGDTPPPPPRAALPELAPMFVSDTVIDLGEIELEDSAAPGAPGTAPIGPKRAQRELPPSPFVSDGVQSLLDLPEDE